MCDRSNRDTQQCFAAVLLSCCYGHRQQLQSSSHIVHKVQGITYLYKKSFVRVQSFTLRIIIRYHTHVHYVNQMRHQALPVVVSNRCSCSGAFIYIYIYNIILVRVHSYIYIFHIYTSIYTFLFVGSFLFLCGGRLFHLERYHKDIPDTTHHSHHTICVDKRYYVVSVTTTSTSFALHNYVCRAMFIRHTH